MRNDLPERYIKALEWVRDGLRNGALSDHYRQDVTMGTPACGTIGCIGGWMATYLLYDGNTNHPSFYYRLCDRFVFGRVDGFGKEAKDDKDTPEFLVLHPLFFGNTSEFVTAKEGADAIDYFLQGSNRPWEAVFPMDTWEAIEEARSDAKWGKKRAINAPVSEPDKPIDKPKEV